MSHGLATTRSHKMDTMCLRLLPGQDLLQGLLDFAKEHALEAACIVTCVGSTGQTTLRPAGVPEPKVFTGKFEIVSLTGTLSRHGHHVHMSVSNDTCTVFGGHLLKGSLVRTTAEIVIGVLETVCFTRPQDERTGYDELSITELQPSESFDQTCKRQRQQA
mmetsp:Transcript_25077/g.46018  ORF Transcript_25077/g.46018 Transcript_25077/m.46018 type:complete len:161 (-) Transcript_25077:138-620(-)